jgi:uncharacterized delta-60 repeat protein
MKNTFNTLRQNSRRTFRKRGFSPASAFIFIYIFLSATISISAVGGGVDPTFNAGVTNFNFQSVEVIAVQLDGRILIGGNFEVAGGVRRNRIARLNADGTIDPSFNPPGGADNVVFAIAPQTDGRILIGGNFSNVNGVSRSFVARLNADGSLDPTFNTSGVNSSVSAILVQPDGKIVIGGAFITSGNASRIRRLNSDGSLDTAFAANVGSGAGGGAVNTLALDANGGILLGGQFTSLNGAAVNRLARLNADGTPDGIFNTANGANSAIESLVVQPDGKILLGGQFTSLNGAAVNRLARLEASGAVDSAFNTGTGASGIVYKIALQPDGRILIGGAFQTFNGTVRINVARINADGTLDQNFSSPFQAGESAPVNTIALQLTGEALIGGDFFTVGGSFRTALAQVDVTGALDADFLPVIGEVGRTDSLLVQTDGKILVSGVFLGVNDRIGRRIARLNEDGTLDTAFNAGAGANGNITAAALQADGKILIGGLFTTFDGTARNRLARLNADGSLDPGFTTTVNSTPTEIIVQPDGKILVVGSFTGVNNDLSRRYIVRLNADGAIDASFAANSINNAIETAARQADGKIVISGFFSQINGAAANRFARLNADGSLDSSFNIGGGATQNAGSLLILANGKILAAGGFSQINGISRPQIARLNEDGSVDAGFSPGTGPNSTVEAIAEQADGRILIGGAFTSYNGVTRFRIARLNADGSLDVSFNPGTGANGSIFDVTVDADGRILIGGNFSAVNAVSRIGIARLLAGSTTLWTGAIDENYENPANWSDNLVPSNADSAEIPAETKNFPIIGGAVNLTSLQINAGAKLTVAAGASLNLQGLANNSILDGGGTLVLSGATFTNNGEISTAVVNVAGRGLKSLGGAGSFAGNILTVSGANLRLDNNHIFNRIVVAAGANFTFSSRVVRLRGAGEALSVSGSLTNNFSTVVYEAAEPQIINHTQFTNLTIDNPAGVSLSKSPQISGTLALINGTLVTNSNLLTLTEAAGAVAANGFVIGRFQKSLSDGQSFSFPVGTANGALPVTVSNIQGTGSFIAQANEGFLAGTNQSQTLQKNWTLTTNGITQADITFRYSDADVPVGADESNFKFVRRGGAVNSTFAPSSFDVSANTFTLSGVTQFSDWTLGNLLPPTAAAVTVGGQVLTTNGQGVYRARISLINSRGETRYANTNQFGFYRFNDVPAGETYILSAQSKQHSFAPPTLILFVGDELADVNFTAQEN